MQQPSSSSDSQSLQQSLLGLLAPPEQKLTKSSKPINFSLKQRMDQELQSKAQGSRRNFKGDGQTARSRSREQLFKPTQRTSELLRQRNHREGSSPEDGTVLSQKAIVISDDEEGKWRELQEEGAWDEYPHDGLNWRQKRKIDRLMKRGLRHFREGKPRDMLSSKVFNTIEGYFK